MNEVNEEAKKDELADRELSSVAGGSYSVEFVCPHCGQTYDRAQCQTRTDGDCANSPREILCPGCKIWVKDTYTP